MIDTAILIQECAVNWWGGVGGSVASVWILHQCGQIRAVHFQMKWHEFETVRWEQRVILVTQSDMYM